MIFRLEHGNRFGDTARVDITTPGLPTVVEVEGTATPFTLKYKNDKSDKSGNFRTSSAEINIYETEEFNIDKLKTSSETEISVKYYINDVKKWEGFVIPDFFSREIGGNAVVSMVASDRISTLKSVTLSDLPEFISILELCAQCLEKTGLDLPLKTMCDFEWSPFGFNGLFRSRVLSQRLTDTKGRSISCYDILGSILTANCMLLQRNGEWYIINKYQHELGEGMLYSTENTPTEWNEVIHNFSEITKGAIETIIPVGASVGVYQEYGGGMSYPENSDFSQGISGWTTYNGFDCEINNKDVLGYIQDLFYWLPSLGDDTEKNNLRCNRNLFNPRESNNPYVESPPIMVTYPDSNSVEITIDINAISTGAFIANPSYINFAVIAKAPDNSLYSLGGSGSFTSFSGNPYFHRERVTAETIGAATTVPKSVTGILTIDDDNLEGYNFYVRIYGSGGAFTPFINSVSASFVQPSDNPKGLIYKSEQGINFTKTHEIETTIFGDFMTRGLNGYFYAYPVDDTSILYNSLGGRTSLWTAPNDSNPLPLLQHVSRQKARLFSVAHNLLRGEIEMRTFDPLYIFRDCNGKRYTLVSADVDFLNSNALVEIEEVAYGEISRRDFIYSYFGDGESGIKSIGGISGGSGGGTGGGLTADQVAILSEVQDLAHDHENKEVLDQVTQEVVDNALREMIISTDTETELTDENYLSSLRVLAEILKNNEDLKEVFLSKIEPDTAQKLIKFLEGIDIGSFTPGLLGSGATFRMNDGVSELEVDKLTVRMIATFFEIIVSKLRHINGGLVLSRGAMTCSRVVEDTDSWQCFFERGENNEISNTFVVNDQARCQVFNGGNQKFYWRLVTAVGDDWIKLSKTVGIGDSIPTAGDDIVQLGYQGEDLDHVKRLNAQIIDESGISQYVEIDSFTLEGKRRNFISADGSGSEFTGKVSFLKAGEEYDLSDWAFQTEENIKGAGNKTYFAKPTEYKRGDRWILTEDTQLLDNFYLKGQMLEAVYGSGEDSDWRLMLIEGDEEATEGINLIRNYDFREGFVHWGAVEGSIVELGDELPAEFYIPSINVIGDEYGYEYAITSENDELIIFDE